jgi:predicted HicB family RNase H-like nuclease
MATLNYEIPDDLHRALKVQAATEGITLKDLIIRLLSASVSK